MVGKGNIKDDSYYSTNHKLKLTDVKNDRLVAQNGNTLQRIAWHETKWSLRGAKCLVKQPLMGLCSPPQPPLVQTQTVTITAVSNSLPSDITTTEVPVIPTNTFIYGSSKVGAPVPAQPRSVKSVEKAGLRWGEQGGQTQP